jgi:hypothetical protein
MQARSFHTQTHIFHQNYKSTKLVVIIRENQHQLNFHFRGTKGYDVFELFYLLGGGWSVGKMVCCSIIYLKSYPTPV